jgi:hypothetical protein
LNLGLHSRSIRRFWRDKEGAVKKEKMDRGRRGIYTYLDMGEGGMEW